MIIAVNVKLIFWSSNYIHDLSSTDLTQWNERLYRDRNLVVLLVVVHQTNVFPSRVENEFMIPINGREWIARSLTGCESFTLRLLLCGLDEGWLVELVVPALVAACRIGLLETRLPKYHISHALSMVMWPNHQIVNGYCLVMFTLLFKPLILNFWIGSVIFCHSALHMLFDR